MTSRQLVHWTGLERNDVLKALLILILHCHVSYETVVLGDEEKIKTQKSSGTRMTRSKKLSLYVLDEDSVIFRMYYPRYLQFAHQHFGILVRLLLEMYIISGGVSLFFFLLSEEDISIITFPK